MTQPALLPIRSHYPSVEEWADALVSVLNPQYQTTSDGTVSAPSSGTTLPILDSLGRTIVDNSGLYAYNAFGDTPIAPDIVQIDTSDLVDAAVDTSKIANLAITSLLVADAAIVNAKIADLAVNDAKIANATITSAKINDLSADKITAGTIGAYTVYVGDTTFKLGGSEKALTITDTQGVPVERVKIGKMGAGTSDYGIVLKDAGGNTILSSSGTTTGLIYAGNKLTSANISTYIDSLAVTSAYIASAAITEAKIGSLAVTTAKIGSAAITEAKIADANITTLKIGANQVTVPVSSYASGTLSFGTSYTTLRSASITPGSGNKVAVICSAQLSGNDSYCSVRVLRGATTIYETTSVLGVGLYLPGGIVLGAPFVQPTSGAITLSDTPGSGTHTYYYQVKRTSGNTTTSAENRSIVLLATKR